MRPTFYWHDYETWGADPRRDRPAQFAGLRTDLDFEPVGRPLVIYARPSDDILPQPQACLITGLTPQQCREEGIPEADFFRFVHDELARPGTCALGYNSLRFDDEFTRYGLYRNCFDPYAREWRYGNSRWDLIDVVRLTRALRPEGIQWPEREDGVPSFRLEALTAANGIEHSGAHDALADVQATIALARLIRTHQPRLFDFLFRHRDKRSAARLLDLDAARPVLHVSRRIPARLGCISPVVPLAAHPRNRNSIVVADLRHDPEPLLALDADEIRERLYTPGAEGRVGLKEVHLNKCPVLVPMNTLTAEAAERWAIDPPAVAARREQLLAHPEVERKLAEVFSVSPFAPVEDPDQALYDGFLGDADRERCEAVRHTPPEALAGLHPAFDDPRLEELLFRYRARNWPETLDARERERWDAFRRRRLTDPEGGASITLEAYRRELSHLAIDPALTPRQRAVVDALLDWPAEIGLD